MKFNQILYELREDRFLSKTDLAKAINATRQQISAYESGDASPNVATLLALADYFGVSADYLLGRKDYITVPKDNKQSYIFLPNVLTDEDYEIIKDIIRGLYKRRTS